MRTRDNNETGGFEPHQRNLGEKDFSKRLNNEAERCEGMGNITAEDLRGIKDAIAVGFQKFINKDRNIYGKKVDRSHMRNPYNAGNYNYGSKDLPSNGTM